LNGLMMASIFFTERLPGISKLQNWFRCRAWRRLVDPRSGPEKLTIVVNHSDPEPASSPASPKAGSMPSCEPT